MERALLRHRAAVTIQTQRRGQVARVAYVRMRMLARLEAQYGAEARAGAWEKAIMLKFCNSIRRTKRFMGRPLGMSKCPLLVL